MDNLHRDIVADILSRLPTESVLRCRLVSKTWETILLHPKFSVNMHLHHQRLLQLDEHNYNNNSNNSNISKVSFLSLIRPRKNSHYQVFYGDCDYASEKKQFVKEKLKKIVSHPPLRRDHHIVGSCNGLICFSRKHNSDLDRPAYICNPVTNEYMNIPQFINIKECKSMVCGFGFVPSTKEYKVVVICCPSDETLGQVHVYTFGGANGSKCGWRKVGDTEYTSTRYFESSGILLNGALHWMDQIDGTIVSFSLADEEFRSFGPPPCGNGWMILKVLGGCLCVLHDHYGDCTVVLDVWILKEKKTSVKHMKKQDDVVQSWIWIKKFSIEREDLERTGILEPCSITESGELLVWYKHKILYSYDSKSDSFCSLVDFKYSTSKILQVIPHVNSFVSLKYLGVEDENIIKKTFSRKRKIKKR